MEIRRTDIAASMRFLYPADPADRPIANAEAVAVRGDGGRAIASVHGSSRTIGSAIPDQAPTRSRA